jgi:hypothetical protein
MEVSRAGIPANWDGAYEYFPLPDLLGNGDLYAANLRACANVDASYLVSAKRVRSLSEFGWAHFRMRRALCDTRAYLDVDDLQRIGAATWHETALWQRWNESGLPSDGFQPWLDGRAPSAGGSPGGICWPKEASQCSGRNSRPRSSTPARAEDLVATEG